MSNPGKLFDRAVQSLAIDLAKDHATVQSGPEAGQSLWEMLTEQQRRFFASRAEHQARQLLIDGAAQHTSPAPETEAATTGTTTGTAMASSTSASKQP